MVVSVSVHTTSNTYDSHGRPFRSKAKGVTNHRDGGRDPTELLDSAQPVITARPVEATPATIIPPSRLWAGKPLVFVVGGYATRRSISSCYGAVLAVSTASPCDSS